MGEGEVVMRLCGRRGRVMPVARVVVRLRGDKRTSKQAVEQATATARLVECLGWWRCMWCAVQAWRSTELGGSHPPVVLSLSLPITAPRREHVALFHEARDNRLASCASLPQKVKEEAVAADAAVVRAGAGRQAGRQSRIRGRWREITRWF